MNKKKLSVVMAGAMLASSVAPVLAATESKVDQNELGSLVEKVYNKVTETLYTTGNTSVYGVKVNDVDVAVDELAEDLKVSANKRALFQKLQEEFKDLTAGDKVVIYSKGFRVDGDKVTNQEVVVKTYNDLELSKKYATIGTAIKDALTKDGNTALIANHTDSIEASATEIKIFLDKDVAMNLPIEKKNINSTGEKDYKVLTLKGTDKELDFTKVLTKDGEFTIGANTPGTTGCTASEVIGFPTKETSQNITSGELVEKIEITGTENNFKTEDLYDGLMLTTAGHDFLSLLKGYDKKKGLGYTVSFTSLTGADILNKNVDLSATKDNEYGVVITVKKAGNFVTKYTIKGAEKDTERLASWLFDRLAKVDILAGANRYETAVSVAREQLGIYDKYLGTTDADKTNDANISNIVLVNGDSLVDGLAAAPLAASLDANEAAGHQAAPVLLTKSDELPKATKDFLRELLGDKTIGDVDTKIHLVGGTAVLSRSLEKELRSYGFEIKRYNGANREETSLEVAEAITSNTTSAFVVGAEGEADAMSIAPVAADTDDVTPIIVAKKGGISYEALDALEGRNVTVVGGESAVSKEDYEAIEEAIGETKEVERVFGENRQATNAAIIKKYYNGSNGITAKSVIVSKDGRGNKDELIDALTVANLAVQKKAPVVLAKKSLSKEQIDALNLRAKSSESLYQVGIGVEIPVMETLAKFLGLAN